jgi:hypothetical protein
VATLADDLGLPSANGSDVDVRPDLAELAERMRGTVTPVLGYLELISQEANGLSRERYLDWITTIERRLDLMRETSDQISQICGVLRDQVNEASTPRAPEAPAD